MPYSLPNIYNITHTIRIRTFYLAFYYTNFFNCLSKVYVVSQEDITIAAVRTLQKNSTLGAVNVVT